MSECICQNTISSISRKRVNCESSDAETRSFIPCKSPCGFEVLLRNRSQTRNADIITSVGRLNTSVFGGLIARLREESMALERKEFSTKERKPVSESLRNENHVDLWVQKHCPQSFSQLLSSEKNNREVLRLVKAWDPYVFKRNIDVKREKESVGHDGRPVQKVILLCGPSGTGKTTLAHVVATHCGYRPYEINASDERTTTMFRDSLDRAMQGGTLSRDGKPNCVIIDEIDGIDRQVHD